MARITSELRLGFEILDYDAIKGAWNTKGANGKKQCFVCKNVLGRTDPFEDDDADYPEHFSTTNYNKFKRHTPESYDVMIDHLIALAESGSNEYGLTYVVGRDVILFGVAASYPHTMVYFHRFYACVGSPLAEFLVEK